MTNDEGMPKHEELIITPPGFVIRHSPLFRYSSFVIRHSAP